MIHNPDHVAGYLLEQGGAELLSATGDAYFAVVFCTADVCRHVWLMDTPGDLYGPDGAGREKALGSVELADGFVLLSPHSGFLRQNDLGLLANIIRRCPPVKAYQVTNHMLFVQSKCGDIEFGEIRTVFEDAIERTKRRLYDTAFEFLEEGGFINALPGEEELAARVQPFWRENERLASRTLRRINDMAAYLVSVRKSLFSRLFCDIASSNRFEPPQSNKKQRLLQKQRRPDLNRTQPDCFRYFSNG